MSTLEVELEYRHSWDGSLAFFFHSGYGDYNPWFASRIIDEIEKVVASLSADKEAKHIFQNQSVISIEPTIKNVYGKLIEYIAREPNFLFNMHPRRFEEIIAELLFNEGWKVELTSETVDGGYDIFAINKEQSGIRNSCIIECKRYAADRKVGINVARQLLQIKNEKSVPNAMIVTSSDFTKGVYDYQLNRLDFSLKNFNALIEWCESYNKQIGRQ